MPREAEKEKKLATACIDTLLSELSYSSKTKAPSDRRLHKLHDSPPPRNQLHFEKTIKTSDKKSKSVPKNLLSPPLEDDFKNIFCMNHGV